MAVEQLATLDLAKLGAGIAIGFGAIGGGLGLGIATKGVLDAIARPVSYTHLTLPTTSRV